MYQNKTWQNLLERYLKKDWIDKPNIFAKTAIKYFPKQGKLLDLASGVGQDSVFFAQKGYSVISSDNSDYGLKLSQQRAKDNNVIISSKKADLSKKLPFKDNTFDIVYCHLGLHYFDDKTTKKIFKEIHRILKPQGIFASLFNSVDDPEIDNPKFKEIDKNYYLETTTGLYKRYFSVNYLKDVIKGLFEPIIEDNKGETYKDEIKTLMRFIGKKI